LPHAMREFAALGLADELLAAAIENLESCFFNRLGQLSYKEPRGKSAGYVRPEVGIHRARLRAGDAAGYSCRGPMPHRTSRKTS